MKNKARQLSQDIAQSAMEDFPETLLDVPIPKTPQQTAVEKTQSTLKEMRESPETSGAMRLAERTLKQHAMMSGVATTSEWATNTFDEKSMAHYKDIARQLSTQMSGTMKEAMEIYATNPPVKAQAKAMGGPAGINIGRGTWSGTGIVTEWIVCSSQRDRTAEPIEHIRF